MIRAPSKKPITVHAIHANKGVEAWYRDRLYRLIEAMHIELQQQLAVAWALDPPEIGFAHDATPTQKIAKILETWGTKWGRKLDSLSLDIASKFAAKAFGMTDRQLEAAFAKSGFTVKFKPTRRSLQAYQAVAAENVGLIKSIPQEYLKDVQTKVWESVKVGADMGTLAKGLRETYGVSTRRAALIARDQNNKAKAVIENTRRQQLGIKKAIWQHSSGGKVPRPTHVSMNGKAFDLTKGSYDRDEKKWVWPGQLINCRCTSRAIIPGLEE